MTRPSKHAGYRRLGDKRARTARGMQNILQRHLGEWVDLEPFSAPWPLVRGDRPATKQTRLEDY